LGAYWKVLVVVNACIDPECSILALISRMVSNGVCKLKEPSIDGNLLNEASNSKEITGETQLETMNGMKGKISLKTPFSNYESNEATILYSNNNDNLIMRGTVNIGNHQSQLNVNIVTSNGINAEICIKTPFTKDFEILLHGNDNIHLFKYELSVSYGDEKVRKWSFQTNFAFHSIHGFQLCFSSYFFVVQHQSCLCTEIT
jgi:hypothetical protein